MAYSKPLPSLSLKVPQGYYLTVTNSVQTHGYVYRVCRLNNNQWREFLITDVFLNASLNPTRYVQSLVDSAVRRFGGTPITRQAAPTIIRSAY